MNFFNRNRANARPADTQKLSPTSPVPPDPIPVDHIPPAEAPSNPNPSSMAPPKSPSSSSGAKRDVFSRFKAVFNKPSKNADGDTQTASAQDPEKIRRREARRAARQIALQDWEEANARRLKEAAMLGEDFKPLPKPAHVPSDSEDEETTVTSADIGTGPVTSAEGPVSDSTRGMPGPYLPENVQPTPGGGGAHMATVEGTHLAAAAPPPPQMPVPGGFPQPHPQHQPMHAQGGRNDAHLADSFGMQAYMGVDAQSAEAYSRGGGMDMHGYHGGAREGVPSAPGGGGGGAGVTHVGWGDNYGHAPSIPMYGNPGMAPMGPMGGMRDVDYVLAEKIRKGRELAKLAVEQEERGNLGAAESGYMRALEFLVPAIKELDLGNELNKQARMKMKSKIKREAAAMLDRVEELKVFLKANGPAVPSELPSVPTVLPSPPGNPLPSPPGRSRDSGNGEARQNVEKELEEQRKRMDQMSVGRPTATSTMTKPPPAFSSGGSDPARPLPPPPPPPGFDNDSGDLLKRLATRQEVFSSVSGGFSGTHGSASTKIEPGNLESKGPKRH